MNLNLAEILKIPQGTANKIAVKTIQNVQEDFKNGIFQNNQSGLKYFSKTYMKYKANQMRRFTKGDGKVFTDKEGYFFGKTYFRNKKAKKWKTITGEHGGTRTMLVHQGKRLSGFYAKTIESTNTAYVDMTLTGQLKKGLKLKQYINGSWLFGYDPKDADKIEGNRKYGREVVGLNDKNQEDFKNMLLASFNENIRTKLKDITIKVRL